MSFQGPSDPPGSNPPPGGNPPPPPPSGGGFPPPPPSAPGFGAPQAPGGYGAPAYGAPGSGGYGPPPVASQTNGLAIGSLVCGILSFFTCGVLGLVGIVLGIFGLGKAKELNGSGKGMAIGGIITGALGILVGVFLVFAVVLAADDANINSDPSDGVCNTDRILEDPDC